MDLAKLVVFLKEHNVNVTLNACLWFVNHSVLEACYQTGAHYFDLAAHGYSGANFVKD